jgi:hypothetical protein
MLLHLKLRRNELVEQLMGHPDNAAFPVEHPAARRRRPGARVHRLLLQLPATPAWPSAPLRGMYMMLIGQMAPEGT